MVPAVLSPPLPEPGPHSALTANYSSGFPTNCMLLEDGSTLDSYILLMISSLPGICLDTWGLSVKGIQLLDTFCMSGTAFPSMWDY